MAYNHLSAPDPELAPLLAALPPAPETFTSDIPAARNFVMNTFIEIIRAVQRPRLPADTAYAVQDHQVPVEGGEINVRTYIPSDSANATFPVMLWTHGGGWVFGNVELDDHWLRILCVDLQTVIVNVDYRLAPEHPFPTGLNDSFTALKWTVQNANRIKADLSKAFIVGGRSAGGNFAAVLAHRAKADPFFAEHPLTGQFLQIPATIHPAAVPEEYKDKLTSHVQNKDAPLLNERHMVDYYEKYGGTPTDPDLSPFLHRSFEGLPPAYMQICGQDPLRDDGLLYAEKLRAAGVPTKVDVYPGAPHGFELALPQAKVSQKYDADSRAGLRWLLSGAK
ncbi:hypothetical protein OH77DRAFT_1426449 [Trametes cingulata]|nr:hypothetical protein OH77DRAFT_1426449 [Trametes cingulata]